MQFWRCSKPKDGSAALRLEIKLPTIEGHTGPLCGLCKNGYAMNYFGACDKCVGGSGAALFQLLSWQSALQYFYSFL